MFFTAATVIVDYHSGRKLKDHLSSSCSYPRVLTVSPRVIPHRSAVASDPIPSFRPDDGENFCP